jgi:hypothetical protein
MSRPPSFVVILALCSLFTPSAYSQVEKEVWEEVSHNVRVMRHRDGTDTAYHRSNDEKTLIKKRISDVKGGRNSILTTTVYRMDERGNPLSCKIFDGKENLLFKVRYGYHRETGRLVAEDMFDARAPKEDPESGEEIPIRRMYWFYDGAGNVSKAYSFVFREGEYAEDAFDDPQKMPSTFPSDNPFSDTDAGPNAGDPGDDAPPPLPPLPFER